MNLLYRGCASKENYQLNILEELRMKGVFNHCTIISQTLDDGDDYPHKFYHEILAGTCYHSNYSSIKENYPSVPKYIWEDLLPYKDNALNMTNRIYNMNIMNYEEMNLLYIQNVEFWNWIIDIDEIDMAFFTCIPHCLWEYIIYSLCKVKNIPTLMIDGHWIDGLNSVATNIENLGSSTIKYMKKGLLNSLDEAEMQFYYKARNHITPLSSRKKRDLSRDLERFTRKSFYGTIIDDIKGLLSDLYYCNIVKKRVYWRLQDSKHRLKMHLRQRINRRSLVTKSYFNKYAIDSVDDRERYNIFFLQFEPESTTLPKAGIYCCQLLTIKMLAEASQQMGIKLYVKEHWWQDYRTKDFYNALRRIPNVYFVNSELDNYLLIDKSISVASQTGSCILEAFLRGKPSIMFAYNAISDAPTVHYVTNKEELNKAIQDAENKQENNADEETRMRYYSSICNTSIRSYLDWPSEWKFRKEDCINDITDLITEFVSQGMPSDFYYERTM